MTAMRTALLLLFVSLAFAACGSSDDAESVAADEAQSNEVESSTEDDAAPTPSTEPVPAAMNIEKIEENLRNQGFAPNDIPDVIDCIEGESEAEGVDFLFADTETFTVLLVRCRPEFLSQGAAVGIVPPPGVDDEQVACTGATMLRFIGELPLAEAADQLFRPSGLIPDEWIEGVASTCELSLEDAQLVLGG